MLTRFYDRTNGRDGPVSGALFSINLHIGATTGNAVAAAATHDVAFQLPAGMSFEITDVRSYCGTVGAAGATLSVGTAVDGQQIVADVALTVGAQTHTIVEGTVAAGGLISARVVGGASTGTVATPCVVTITGFVASPPTTVLPRTVAGTGY